VTIVQEAIEESPVSEDAEAQAPEVISDKAEEEPSEGDSDK
jgi:hypothetical protein